MKLETLQYNHHLPKTGNKQSSARLGIVLGGIITTFVGWQYIFYINIPIGVAAVFLGLKYKDKTRVQAKVNLFGIILLGVALTLLALGATSFAADGLNVQNSMLMIVGAVLIPIFVFYDSRLKGNAIIDFNAFKNRVLKNSVAASFFVSLGYFSVVFLIIMYLQGVRGLSPLNASLLLIPGYVAGSFLGP